MWCVFYNLNDTILNVSKYFYISTNCHILSTYDTDSVMNVEMLIFLVVFL